MQFVNGGQIISNVIDPEQLLVTREWQELRPGVRISWLYTSEHDGPSAAFLHYAAGASVPVHKHTDFEHILVLHGAQHDGRTLHGKGALLISEPGTQHAITSETGCIALAIWVKPVEFV